VIDRSNKIAKRCVKNKEHEVNKQIWPPKLLIFVFSFIVITLNLGALADQFKLGVEEKGYLEGNGYPTYPSPQMVPNPQPIQGGAANDRFNGGASSFSPAPKPRQPLNAGVQRIVLPPDYLGAWLVQGQRIKVEALPEFQQEANAAFALNNSQVWTIRGNANGGYSMGSNTGVETALIVDKVQGTTAWIRYRHPVGNTMAQEAIVMSLLPGGMRFDGLERISIVKQGLSQPRAKVTYQLAGQRQS
jgi:hypothetical protein